MLRAALAVIAGYAVWTVIWLAGGAGVAAAFPGAFPEEGRFEQAPPLIALLVLSLVCSLAAGASCGAIAKSSRPVLITAILLLITGIGVQAAAWSSYPLWYHIPFLALLIPATGVGGHLILRKNAASAANSARER